MPDMKKASAANRGPSKNTDAETNDTPRGTGHASNSGAQRKYPVATIAGAGNTFHWKRSSITWAGVCAWAEKPASVKECGGYVLGTLRQTTVKHDERDCTGWHRNKEAIVSRGVLTLDADTADSDLADKVDLTLGCSALIHTTFNHAPGDPRLRLLFPLDRDVTPEEYRHIAAVMMHRLGIEQFDHGSAEPERFMFKPSSQDGATYWHRVLEGPLLNVDAVLAQYNPTAHPLRPSKAAQSPSEVVPYTGPAYAAMTPQRRAQIDSYVSAIEKRWRAALAAAADWPEVNDQGKPYRDEQDRGWEALVRDAALAFAGLAAPWSPLDEDDAKRRLMAALSDEMLADEVVAVEKKWPYAVRKARREPLPPPAGAVDDFDELPDEEPMIVAPLPGLDLDMLRAAEEAVFGATPTLGQVRQLALARMVSPWAVLTAALARVLAETPVGVVLPAVISSQAVLNLGVAVVGGSGIGKTGGMNVAGELLDTPPAGQDASPRLAHRILLGDRPKQTGAGSGEGLIQSFLKWVKPEGAKRGWFELADHPHVLMRVDEVGQIAAVQGRNGSTLASVFRSALTGDPLQTTNATADRLRDVPAKKYRFCAVVGVQPELSDALLNEKDAAGGTPQRLLWSLAAYPWMPEDTPDDPGGIGWVSPWPPGSAGEVAVPAEAVNLIRSEQIAKHRGIRSNLDGHALLTRLRVGAALAMLHGERDITSDWWLMAGELIRVSDAVRAGCSLTLARHAMDQAAQRGRQQAKTDLARDDDLRQEAVKRSDVWARAMWRLVYQHETQEEASNRKHKKGEGCTSRCLNYSLRNHRKSGAESDAVLADAVERDWLAEAGGRVHLGQECPEEEVEE